jgi:hypothetical protein
MKRRKFLHIGAAGAAGAALSSAFLASCDSMLEPEVHSQLAPSNLTDAGGIRAALAATYAEAQWGGTKARINNMSEWMTDVQWQTGGGENRVASVIIQFNWGTDLPPFNFTWNKAYRAVRDANIIIENVGAADISEEQKALYQAEARFVRGMAYWDLYRWYGPVPLRTSSSTNEQPAELARASEEEMRTFLETEFTEIIPALPPTVDARPDYEYGRATAGAARGWLMRFLLNTKQWQKAADTAQDIIDMNAYSLFDEESDPETPAYLDMFRIENERNSEYIWADYTNVEGPGTNILNGTFPPGFQRNERTGLTWQGSWANWASQYRILDDFYNSFDPADDRRAPIIAEYFNFAGDKVDLLADFDNNTRAFKPWPDPGGQGNFHGNDQPRIRYSAVLLARAEALNELRGPNQESIDLVNQVRARASLDEISVSDFSSTQELREYIVIEERGWEFYREGLRRDDLRRIDKFIEIAEERAIYDGGPIDPTRRLFPIPQSAIDANPALEQNPGYGANA